MTDIEGPLAPGSVLGPDRLVCPDSVGRVLLEAAGYAARGRSCHDLDHVPVLGRHPDQPEPLRQQLLRDEAWEQAVAAEDAGRLDPDAIAEWIVKHYPAATYPAAVLGSPHGSAVHLAAALRAPWLPTGFTVTVRWAGGEAGDWAGALDAGAAVARRLLRDHPDVTVRQVHDPLQHGHLCASTLTLHIRWRRLPRAYRVFLTDRLAPGGQALLLRDVRTWPVLTPMDEHSFQLGSPVSGWQPGDYTPDNPAFATAIRTAAGVSARAQDPYPDHPRRYAETVGEPQLETDLRQATAASRRPTHRVLYPDPATLSACVADIYRDLLRTANRPADRCLVETERQIDPWQVLSTGLVPYWCETSARHAVSAAEWWLAGSRPFDSVTVLPAPPGTTYDSNASRAQWRAVAWFGRHHEDVSHHAMRHYPLHPLPAGHAATVLEGVPRKRSAPVHIGMVQLLEGLRRTGRAAGVMVL